MRKVTCFIYTEVRTVDQMNELGRRPYNFLRPVNVFTLEVRGLMEDPRRHLPSHDSSPYTVQVRGQEISFEYDCSAKRVLNETILESKRSSCIHPSAGAAPECAISAPQEKKKGDRIFIEAGKRAWTTQ